MAKFKVIMDFAGWLELEIKANTEEEAREMAWKEYSHHDIVELEILNIEIEDTIE